MAERQFIIRIDNNTGTASAGEKVGGAGGIKNKQGGGSTQKTSSSDDSGMAIKKAIGAGLIAYHKVRNVQDQIVNHQNSLIEITTGSKEQQERRTFAYNTVTGFVDAAVTGAASGAMVGGGYGAIAGAILGVAKQGTDMLVNILKTQDQLNKMTSLENISRGMAAQRVTISGSRYMNATQM